MLIKKEKNYFKYLKYLLLLAFLICILVFRNFFIESVLTSYSTFFSKDELTQLTLAEREELEKLKIENSILRDENKKVRTEFSVGDIDEDYSVVYMLLGASQIYGSFFVSLPQGKTPYIGMNVFTSRNIVVGQVEEILSNSLKVSLLGQNKSFIANSLENEESLELGTLGNGLYVGKVSGGSKISLGDTIVLKGYPKAVVGTVVEIQKGDASLSNVFVRTPYNISNKEIFYVVQ